MSPHDVTGLETRPVPAPRGETRERILVIDDEENIRTMLEEFMTLNGYRVDTATDGSQGLDLLGRQSYDLVLTDLRMPGVDGTAVIEWVHETHPEVPVIVMTGHATVESTIQALRLGAYDYLIKPFTLDEIERTIGNCVESRRLRRENVELTESNERLREIERLKDDLLATVSHEFRTPLTAMKGFLSMLERQGMENLRPDQEDAVDAIRANVNRLDSMIGNLLTLTEAHDGTYQPILEPIGLGEFLDEYVELAALFLRGKNLRIEGREEMNGVRALLDRSRFPLALTNLLENAFKFAKDPADQEVVLRVRRKGPKVVIEVHDNGIGIESSLGDRAFERFTQADMTSTREYPGAGLGLAVVREIVASHGGTVRLTPPVLGGASVRIELPVAPDPEEV